MCRKNISTRCAAISIEHRVVSDAACASRGEKKKPLYFLGPPYRDTQQSDFSSNWTEAKYSTHLIVTFHERPWGAIASHSRDVIGKRLAGLCSLVNVIT